MKTFFAVFGLTLCALASAQTAPSFQAPLDSQVWGTTWNCKTDGTANIDVQGPVDDGTGNYYGVGYFSGFRCTLRVTSGHAGAGVQYLSACADVVWDQNGFILSVTPFAKHIGYPGIVPCSP